MKVKNIVFSGFAAAILMGAVDANAAFSIASKDYVDAQTKITVGNEQVAIKDVVSGLTSGENSVDSKIEDVVGDLTDSENGLDGFAQGTDTVVEALNELKGDATNAATAAATAQTAAEAAQSDVDALAEDVGDVSGLTGFAQGTDTVVEALNELNSGKADATATTNALAGKVNVSDAATSIGAAASASDTKWATEKAVAEALASVTGGAGSVSQQIEDALGNLGTGNTTVEDALADKADASYVNTLAGVVGDASSGLVADVTALETAVGDTNSGLTKSVADNASAIAALQTNTAVTSGITAEKVSAYDTKMTQLNGTCTSESDYCVLAKGQDGVMQWVEITLPFSVN